MSHYNGLMQLVQQFGNSSAPPEMPPPSGSMAAAWTAWLGPQPFAALGFPCNQFMGQEPGDNSEILNTLKYVRPGGGYEPPFPLTAKVTVNGLLQHPIWSAIKAACPAPEDDIADITPSWTPVRRNDVAWNFETVLLDKKGVPFRRYSTPVQPTTIAGDIAYLLAQ